MMIFSEIYGAYFNTVSKIIEKAIDGGISLQEIRSIISQYAFCESMAIEQSLLNGTWQLLSKDGTTPIKHKPQMPMTLTEKRWLKAISMDKRIKLFDCDFSGIEDIEPLFCQDDYYIFDKAKDGDDYDDENYVRIFKTVYDAVKTGKCLNIVMRDRKGRVIRSKVMPKRMEYSEKDDKFRLISSGSRYMKTINISRIIDCFPCECDFHITKFIEDEKKQVKFCVSQERNALERVLMHFAHFEKEAFRDGDTYTVSVTYDKSDENEIIIRIMSFGPMVEVTEPEYMRDLIKNKLKKQKKLDMK